MKVECTERAIGVAQHDLRMALKNQRKSAPGGADIDCLPQPV